MTGSLPAARAELDRWRRAGLALPFWWRDDDAVAPTPALDRLIALADRFGAPLHLAVIPRPATEALAERLRGLTGIFVFTHGWNHVSHAPGNEKKAEFGPHRELAVMLGEIEAGRQRLHALFADRALPVFTPPWNRIAPTVVERLAALGFRALSTFTPRGSKFVADGLLQVNTHLDPVAWKSGGGLLETALLDNQVARDLQARRTGQADNAEPYGLLTHHLVQDDATWNFISTLLQTLQESGVATWTPPLREID